MVTMFGTYIVFAKDDIHTGYPEKGLVFTGENAKEEAEKFRTKIAKENENIHYDVKSLWDYINIIGESKYLEGMEFEQRRNINV